MFSNMAFKKVPWALLTCLRFGGIKKLFTFLSHKIVIVLRKNIKIYRRFCLCSSIP